MPGSSGQAQPDSTHGNNVVAACPALFREPGSGGSARLSLEQGVNNALSTPWAQQLKAVRAAAAARGGKENSAERAAEAPASQGLNNHWGALQH